MTPAQDNDTSVNRDRNDRDRGDSSDSDSNHDSDDGYRKLDAWKVKESKKPERQNSIKRTDSSE